MEVKRIYKKELSRLIYILVFCILAISSIILYINIRDNKTSFEYYLKTKDYDKIYSMIDDPDFSFGMFKQYFIYNFGENPVIQKKISNKKETIYTFSYNNQNKNIKFKKQNGKKVWAFDDYVYDWHIKMPQNAKLYIESTCYNSNNGEVIINRIPSSMYNLNCSIDNLCTFNQNVFAGQNLQIKMELLPKTLSKVETAIKSFLNFKEKALNGTVEQCIYVDENTGLYKEIAGQCELNKNLDYKVNNSLIKSNINKVEVNEAGEIVADVNEEWKTIINNEDGDNEKITEQNNIYYMKYDGDIKIKKLYVNEK